jgi:hypothetical protein
MLCEDCGKIREENYLKPRETLVLPVEAAFVELTD